MKDMMEEMDSTDGKEHEDYEIECAARDVLKAEEIKADPEMWPKVQAKLKAQGDAIKKITSMKQLKDVIKEKNKADMEMESES